MTQAKRVFFSDLRGAIRKEDDTAAIGYCRLKAIQNEYTSFAGLDLNKECESPYSQHHRILNESVLILAEILQSCPKHSDRC
jgi:hypothetical protein